MIKHSLTIAIPAICLLVFVALCKLIANRQSWSNDIFVNVKRQPLCWKIGLAITASCSIVGPLLLFTTDYAGNTEWFPLSVAFVVICLAFYFTLAKSSALMHGIMIAFSNIIAIWSLVYMMIHLQYSTDRPSIIDEVAYNKLIAGNVLQVLALYGMILLIGSFSYSAIGANVHNDERKYHAFSVYNFATELNGPTTLLMKLRIVFLVMSFLTCLFGVAYHHKCVWDIDWESLNETPYWSHFFTACQISSITIPILICIALWKKNMHAMSLALSFAFVWVEFTLERIYQLYKNKYIRMIDPYFLNQDSDWTIGFSNALIVCFIGICIALLASCPLSNLPMTRTQSLIAGNQEPRKWIHYLPYVALLIGTIVTCAIFWSAPLDSFYDSDISPTIAVGSIMIVVATFNTRTMIGAGNVLCLVCYEIGQFVYFDKYLVNHFSELTLWELLLYSHIAIDVICALIICYRIYKHRIDSDDLGSYNANDNFTLDMLSSNYQPPTPMMSTDII